MKKLKINKNIFLGLLCSVSFSSPEVALAASTTANLTVTATVNATCTITAPTPLAFGIYTPSTVLPGSTTIPVTCTNTTPYNVGLGVGTGSGATVAARKMTNGANLLEYSLYSDAGHTTVWGSTIGTDTVAGTGTGLAQSITVYGQIPSTATPAAGSYTDTVAITVTY